jgi:hypothetical protein
MVASLFGFDTLHINVGNAAELRLILNDQSYALDEIGNRFANTLCMLVSLARDKPRILLIDEPEASLHPSLQQAMLAELVSLTDGLVYFAIHALGLARSLGTTVTSLQKTTGGVLCHPLQVQKNFSEFFGEMSFAAWCETGFQAVLFVEGATDILTLQELLQKLNRRDRVLILSVGGSQMIHGIRPHELAELQRLNRPVYVLIDSEVSSVDEKIAKTRSDFLEVCRGLNYESHALARRASENYFAEHAIQKIVGAGARALGHYEKLKDMPSHQWSKGQNWQIAREMTREDFVDTDLGQFLAHLVSSLK